MREVNHVNKNWDKSLESLRKTSGKPGKLGENQGKLKNSEN